MGQIEVTAAVRRTPDAIFDFLVDFRSHETFFPSERFRYFQHDGDDDRVATSLKAEVYLMRRWWEIELRNQSQDKPTLLSQASTRPVSLEMTWGLTALKADRRGPRTAVKLSVRYVLPGGRLGRLANRLLLQGEALKVFDHVIRNLPLALEGGPPKSGLKKEGL